jgi:activator of HSP90 ATPase
MADQIEKTYLIDASPEKAWNALTNPLEIEGWGAGPAKMIAVEGTDFSLWGGDIYGRNVEVKEPNYLRQEWYSTGWAAPSTVEIWLTEDSGQTKLRLSQNGVPAEEVDDIDNGWDEYYLGAMKEYLEL